jgi:25S rRNA (adenine2142-N1)-methyltransferase
MAKSKPRPRRLTSGRPPLFTRPPPTLSSKATRTLIRQHHTLLKSHASALASNDDTKAAALAAALSASGGLERYQHASTLGQSSPRGGDSSRLLVTWLGAEFSATYAAGLPLRILEIGALSVSNACSRVKGLEVQRIDLHSQDPGIREIDFMELLLPGIEAEKFHLVSLSLVLNFVPEASARGEMLRRIPQFLQTTSTNFPSYLFFVLPLPCIENARYMDESRLEAIMGSLGFTIDRVKKTAKLYYSLWRYKAGTAEEKTFAKKEVRKGRGRNNFAILLR